MPPGLIVLAVVVGISLFITLASNWLRSQQRNAEAAAAERRARNRSESASAPAARAGASDIDRFLEEINKLRQKPAGGAEPAPRPPRKAEPVKPAKAVPTAAPRRVEPVAPPPSRFDDLPVAPVVAKPVPLPPPPAGASKPIVMQPAGAVAPPTRLARQFTGLLSNPQSLPMAVLLQEVFGPPKCKRQ